METILSILFLITDISVLYALIKIVDLEDKKKNFILALSYFIPLVGIIIGVTNIIKDYDDKEFIIMCFLSGFNPVFYIIAMVFI